MLFLVVMDRNLQGMPKVYCYLDDSLIGAETIESCKQWLEVYDRWNKFNVKFSIKNCGCF